MKILVLLLLLMTVFPNLNARADMDDQAEADLYFRKKIDLIETDEKSREIMGNLYNINKRMKLVSKKRNILSSKVLGAQSDVRSIAHDTAELEEKIKEQRQHLSHRLRAMYMLGSESVVRTIFSSANARDLDQSIKFLKLISDHDISLLKKFNKNLLALERKRKRLKVEVKSLISIKNQLKKQEELLSKDQVSKAVLLKQLKHEKTSSLRELAGLRNKIQDSKISDMLDLSFYEHKGRLAPPVKAKLKLGFGLIENEKFHYKLAHKGYLYSNIKSGAVNAIFAGSVSFVGEIEGYGETIIIDHGDHFYSVYSGVQKSLVQEGQSLKKIESIAKSNGELYFELRHFSDPIDPGVWLAER